MSKLNIEQLTDLYLLLSVEGIGPGKIRSLLAKFHSTEKILSTDYHSLTTAEGISTNLAQRIRKINSNRNAIKSRVEEELTKLDKLNAKLITIWDKEYPKLLKKIYDPPIIIEIKGKLIDQDEYSIAIVGTRQPTNYGKVQAERIASDLAEQSITIVSGMARGIDSISHSACLKRGGRTIAVIGSGLDVIYPPENRKLFDTICERGAVISEFPLGTKPDAQNFPRRNRIISGLRLSTWRKPSCPLLTEAAISIPRLLNNPSSPTRNKVWSSISITRKFMAVFFVVVSLHERYWRNWFCLHHGYLCFEIGRAHV